MLYELILPFKISGTLTYHAGHFATEALEPGTRVLVPFRKNKVVTGLVSGPSTKIPVGFTPRKILAVADDTPLINEKALRLWEWMADYYLCTLGEVMSAAIPAVLRPQGDMLLKRPDLDLRPDVNDALLDELYQHSDSRSIHDAFQFLNKKNEPAKRLYEWLQNGMLQWDDSNIQWGEYRTRSVLLLKPTLESDEVKLSALLDDLDKKSPRQAEVMMLFLNRLYGGLPVFRDELKKENGYNDAALSALLKKGVLISERLKSPLNELQMPQFTNIELSEAQQTVYHKIGQAAANDKTTLLHGITGSGKTEIYLKLCQDAINEGKQALFLMPEIALTAQMINRVQKALGPCVVVVHSDTGDKEKTEQWEQISSGKARLILGARSAIFSPFKNLGLIIVDEEHESAYKQRDPAPRYHGRDAAIMLGQIHEAHVLLGSATPSVESYLNAETGKYALLKLDVRFSKLALPEMLVVDMRESLRKREAKNGFSLELITAIQAQLEQQRQAIIFRNRKGYAPHIQCRQCGWLARCRNCDISLSYFKLRNIFKCHLCGYTTAAVTDCPSCHADSLMIKGTGTERVEENFEEIFPELKAARMDSETSSSRLRRQQIIGDFERGLTDVLIGTQILAKGFDFKGVGLVGVLEADGIWSFPDFRADERAFQLMMQVAGRAGRAGQQGLVIIQTFNPDYPLLAFLKTHDYEGYYQREREHRRITGYPPFLRLIHLSLRHPDRYLCHDAATHLREMIFQIIPYISEVIIPGIERSNNRYYREMLIKLPRNNQLTARKNQLLKCLQQFREIKKFAAVNVVIDVDPYF